MKWRRAAKHPLCSSLLLHYLAQQKPTLPHHAPHTHKPSIHKRSCLLFLQNIGATRNTFCPTTSRETPHIELTKNPRRACAHAPHIATHIDLRVLAFQKDLWRSQGMAEECSATSSGAPPHPTPLLRGSGAVSALFGSGLVSGLIVSGVFNPWDRSVSLSSRFTHASDFLVFRTPIEILCPAASMLRRRNLFSRRGKGERSQNLSFC